MFEEEIKKILKQATGLEEINLEIPPDQKFGDFAFPCFQLSKKLKKNPAEIAQELSTKIKPNNYLNEVKAVGPYLNIFVNKEKLAGIVIKKVMQEKEKYGSSNTGKGQKTLVEHSSINPNAEPHVGRTRNALIGDSIVKILKFQGYKVETHFFVNDVGKQIAMLVLAARGKALSFKKLLALYVEFNNRLKEKPELEKEVFETLYNLEKGDNKIKKEFEKVVKICIKGQKELLEELGIKFDFFDYESQYLWSKRTNELLEKLLKIPECFKDSDGRVVINQEEFKNEMRSPYLVITRSDGTSLYALRDIAYTIDKMKKAPGRNILVLGEDQKLYFKQLSSALKLLGYKSPEAVHYSFVLLETGKMSTRKGEVVLLSDFMNEAVSKAESEVKKRGNIKNVKQTAKMIGYGALKYSILRVSPEKNVTFNWDVALSFEGETAPYIQYAHARCTSILKKAKIKMDKNIDFSLLKTNEEQALIKEISSFPDVVLEATNLLKPHVIATYLYSLSKTFSEFYHVCPCIIDDKKLSNTRLSLVLSTKQVLKTGLSLLGVESPDRM
ncbi:MAG: arginine--tRNA ligase [Nanoarchaeota archaeon]|nr:arginine--tRNA ligase [Nanoarchaeota archaeon]